MANIRFLRGLRANMPTAISDGAVYFVKDEAAVYADIGTERVRFGDFQEFASLTALRANVNPSTTALYYVRDINCLCKWNGSDYIQINLDTGMTSVAVVGEGNVITESSYSADTRKLTLTKGATMATKAELDALDAYVGEIPADKGENIVEYINKKAEETLSAAQGGTSETAASVSQALQNYKDLTDPRLEALEAVDHSHDNATVLNGITAEKVAAWDGAQAAAEATAAAELKKLADGQVTTNKNAIAGIKNGTSINDFAAAETAIATAKASGDTAQANVNTLSGKVGEVAEGKTVVQMIAEAKTAATYDDSAVLGRLDTIEGDYLKAADKTELSGLVTAEKTRAEAAEKVNADAIAVEKGRLDAFLTLEDGQTLNTALDSLKELQDYITNEATEADVVVGKVAALEGIVDGIGGEGEKATVVEYVNSQITGLKIGDYAKAADLTALENRVSPMEAKVTGWDDAVAKKHEHGNKTVLDGITANKVTSWDDAATKAHTHAEGAIDVTQANMDAKLNASVYNEFIETVNADAIADAKKAGTDAASALNTYKTNNDAAVAELKGVTDGLGTLATKSSVTETELGTDLKNKINGKADKATTLGGYGITDAYTKSDVYAKTETYAKGELYTKTEVENYVTALLTWGEF